MISVANIKKLTLNEWPANYVYIGRANGWLFLPASKWANPFVLHKEADRESCLENYRNYILKNEDLLARLSELDDKVLVCYCHPQRCHGDVLIELREAQLRGSYYEQWSECGFHGVKIC